VQTFNENDLKLLARGHDASDARNTFRLLREAGFENVSFDLIAGLPGQTLADWRSNLAEAVSMSPEHLSLYLLEIHEGTPLAEQVRSDRRPVPDPELAAEMYEVMIDTLAAAGYEQYEVSAYARDGYRCEHNLGYWRFGDYLGIGAGAHGKLTRADGAVIIRTARARHPAQYLATAGAAGRVTEFTEQTWIE
jgi:oxygen-independent coproporphyrinogen-3 oxidase